jgi:hypothetical protein
MLLCASNAWGDPPNISFAPGGVGLNVPCQANMLIDSYGRTQLVGGVWLNDGDAGRTTGSSNFARYQTSIEGQSTMTTMGTNQDWLIVIEYKHTGAYANSNVPWFVKHFEDDIRMIGLWNDGGGDNWSLRIGDATGANWIVLVSGLTLDVFWNTFKIHYKSATQTLDAYLNNTLIASDFSFGHGRYDVNHIQIESIGDGTDWYSLIQIGEAVANTRSLTFGHEWVRSHPINTQGLVQRAEAVADSKYRHLNFSTLLAWKNRPDIMNYARDRQGLPWHYHSGKNPLDQSLIDTLNDHLQNRPGGEGILVWDEPTRVDNHDVMEVTDWIRTNYPDLLVYGNMHVNGRPGSNYGQSYGTTMLPGGGYEDPPVPYDYDTFVDDYMNVVRPDILMFDTYPFTDGPDEFTDEYLRDRSYYRGLEIIRTAAMRANVPYWVYIQSFDGGGTYLPSESDLRMQVFSSLAYGFTGIGYFVFGPWGDYGTTDGGLTTWGDPAETTYIKTPLYDPAAVVNLEIQNLGRSLKFLKSTQVRYRVGQYIDPGTQQPASAPLPWASTAWNAATDDPYITSISVNNPGSLNDNLPGDLLIGHFVPAVEEMDGPSFTGEIYFMIVNLLRDQNTSADQASQDVTINFDFQQTGITQLQRLNAVTGLLESVSLTNDGGSLYHIDLDMRGGSGQLFKYDTGAPFVIGPDPAPKVDHIAPGPGLNAPSETGDAVVTYGRNSGVAGVSYIGGFAGTIQVGGFARYSTTLANDNGQITPMPTDEDWVFKITYGSEGPDFNDSALLLKAKEKTPQEEVIVNLVNNGTGTWSLKGGSVIVATDLAFDNQAFHTLAVHYKSASQTLDAYVDDVLVAGDFTLSHGDYAAEYVQVNGYAAAGTLCSYHGIEIGQRFVQTGICGDGLHPILAGDFNEDCLVNLVDLSFFMQNWQTCTAPVCP